jgi:hypothetical protein
MKMLYLTKVLKIVMRKQLKDIKTILNNIKTSGKKVVKLVKKKIERKFFEI